MIRFLILVGLAVAVFGSGAYWTYELFLRPNQDLKMEKELGPGAVPVDPSLPAFEQCLALKKQLKLQEEIKREWSKKTTAANLLLLSQLLMTQTIEIKN